jgi:hypothetical protein
MMQAGDNNDDNGEEGGAPFSSSTDSLSFAPKVVSSLKVETTLLSIKNLGEWYCSFNAVSGQFQCHFRTF